MERRNIKNVRIIKRLLERPDGSWTKYALAKKSGASQPFGLKVIDQLERKGLVDGTRVKDMEGLARYGSGVAPGPVTVVEFYLPEPVEFIQRNVTGYAVTTYFAENMVTHHLFPSRCDVYITRDAFSNIRPKVLNEALIGGGNTRLIVPVDENIVEEAQSIRGVRIVSMGQLMLDLVREGGVCMEAFEMVVRRIVSKD